jgi:hypothetical protein
VPDSLSREVKTVLVVPPNDANNSALVRGLPLLIYGLVDGDWLNDGCRGYTDCRNSGCGCRPTEYALILARNGHIIREARDRGCYVLASEEHAASDTADEMLPLDVSTGVQWKTYRDAGDGERHECARGILEGNYRSRYYEPWPYTSEPAPVGWNLPIGDVPSLRDPPSRDVLPDGVFPAWVLAMVLVERGFAKAVVLLDDQDREITYERGA